MSKKFEALKDMVLYAQQKPEDLAEILVGLVTDTITYVRVNGAKEVEIPTESQATYTFKGEALSQFGDHMEGEVTLSLASPVEGVSISGTTVTVQSTCKAKDFTIKATSSDITATHKVILKKAVA